MIYKGNEVLDMNADTFYRLFYNKYVQVIKNDDSEIQGRVTQVEFATNINLDTKDHLPVNIIIDSKLIDVFDIKMIKTI